MTPPVVRAPGTARASAAAVLGAVAAWLVFGLLGGSSAAAVRETVVWALAVAVGIGVGVLLLSLLPARGDAAPAAAVPAAVVLAAAGWAVANSGGWTLDVNVGGPLTGLATAAAVLAGSAAARGRHVAVVLVALVGVLVGRLASVAVPTVLGLALTAGCGLLAFLAGRRLLAPRTPVRPVVGLVAGWGTAWVGSWFVTTRVLTAYSEPLAVAAEIVLAMAVGGVVTALAVGGAAPARADLARSALRWGLLGAAAVAAGWLVALAAAVVVVGDAAATPTLLDVGTTVTLPIAAVWGLLPVLRTTSGALR